MFLPSADKLIIFLVVVFFFIKTIKWMWNIDGYIIIKGESQMMTVITSLDGGAENLRIPSRSGFTGDQVLISSGFTGDQVLISSRYTG